MQPYNDPLYTAQQWVIDSLNVQPVWDQGLLGQGVMLRINDPTGVDVTHSELGSNLVVEASCEDYFPLTTTDYPDRGTQMASIAVGASGNGNCALGVAPMAVFSACGQAMDYNNVNAASLMLNSKLNTTFVSINAWSSSANSNDCNMLSAESLQAIKEGIEEGRNGKGIIYVFSAGK